MNRGLPREQHVSPARFRRFGVFEIDLEAGELRKRGLRVQLQEQPFQVLALLLERAGELVKREDIRRRLWPDGVHVDFEQNLNKAIYKVRAALGDLADSPRYIETLARRGYRFVAPVESVSDEPAHRSGPGAQAAVRILWEGRAIPLREGENVIGRDADVVVIVDSRSVSHRHAVITLDGHRATLSDLGSKNGTFVNAHPLRAPAVLADGDEIVVGTARLVFRSEPIDGRTTTVVDLSPEGNPRGI